MFSVEYLILVNNDKSSCTSVSALLHLLQSDADIKINESGEEITYKSRTFELSIIQGSSQVQNENGKSKDNTYFHIKTTCRKKGELQAFTDLLRSVRKVVAPLLLTPSALQILWDDVSIHYATRAYPHLSRTENLMRKLITKFMHINLGVAWPENRMPDDVQKSINTANTETTYLYNVDFIKLRDILLSESYPRDRDALIAELKNSKQTKFSRDEIMALIPMSNWEKYFSSEVKFDADEFSSLWTQLYDVRNKVAHNKPFTLDDLNKVMSLTKKINPLLVDAVDKLDQIHLDKADADKVLGDAVANASKSDSGAIRNFMDKYRSLTQVTYHLTTPLNKIDTKRRFVQDVMLMKTAGYINGDDFAKILKIDATRNLLVQNISDGRDSDEISGLSVDLDNIVLKLQQIAQNKDIDINA